MYGQAYANQNASMMGMGMGMGGMAMMGMAGGGGLFNNVFMFNGNAIGLQTRLESLTPAETSTVREATINCTGTQLTEMNTLCLVCTILWGSFLIFPLCFMCCDWWMSLTYPAFDVPENTYRALAYLLNGTPIQTLVLCVTDNRLNKQKCQVLYELLSRSHLKGFTFINMAMNFDFEANEYSNFVENMRPIKQLPISSEIKWGRHIVFWLWFSFWIFVNGEGWLSWK